MRTVLFTSLFLSILSGLAGMWLYRNKALQSESNSLAKSQFLSVMSHEIRTPMNAITGMSELLLRRNLPDDARQDVQDIKQASSNLISIINDILDFSKIEAGKLEIIPINYLFSSLVNDAVNIIRMRLIDKPIRFYTNIDSKIPNNLFGDEVRLRQIILNLLSNAAKFTEKGHVSMTITMDKKTEKQVWLRFIIADTGQGITPEDQSKLFGDFAQVNIQRNRGMEGTGLGLSISKRLCLSMGGDITVSSEFGKGSEFTVTIPQNINSEQSFATVSSPEAKNVLIYEGRTIYAKSLGWSMENLGVPYVLVNDEEEFAAALGREEWFYVFSGYGLYEKIQPIMDKTEFKGGNKPPLALMVEWGTEAFIPNVRFISLPVQSLSIANTLNGKLDKQDYFDSAAAATNMIRFIIPGARLLIVDDIAVNLKVAEGLMAPYRAKLDTCLSGEEAIEMVKNNNYDIVFMDHMMPEMDGIEATAIIREWEREQSREPVPIVALTANAVSGMKEMFIEKGFNDFLAKPIDVTKLDEILDRWIIKEMREFMAEKEETITMGISSDLLPSPEISSGGQPETRASGDSIPGLDIKHGIAMTGGTMDGYKTVLSLFCKDVEDRMSFLLNVPEEDDVMRFVTQVHAMKSASASIGAAGISERAEELEAAGKAKDMAIIREKLPSFRNDLSELLLNIKPFIGKKENINESGSSDGSSANNSKKFLSLLHELKTALEAEKVSDIDRLLDDLLNENIDPSSREKLEKISDDVLMTEFQSAIETINELLH